MRVCSGSASLAQQLNHISHMHHRLLTRMSPAWSHETVVQISFVELSELLLW